MTTLYEQFRRTLDILPHEGRMMPYRWGALPQSVSAVWIPYGLMFDEFAGELANSINDLTQHVRRLRAWSAVVEPLSDDDKLEVVNEFIEVLATVAVSLPYVIRSRFIFATAHLCHQANLANEESAWRDDLPLDSEIYMKTADEYGKPWRAYKTLKRRLEAVSGKEYQKKTHDFRNAYNHRFSPRFVIGETQFVTRQFNPATGSAAYAIGGVAPLELPHLADLLAAERDRCYAAYDAFERLVREHEAAIAAWHTRVPGSI